MKKLMLYVALMLPMCLGAQQNVGFKKSQVEPLVINADKSVTFNVEAPKAKSVTIRGDWEANGGKGELKKGKDGVWSYTTPPLPSEMYTYRIDIDGVMNIAPDNPFSCRDVGNLFSQFYMVEYGDYHPDLFETENALNRTNEIKDAIYRLIRAPK